MSNLVSPIAGPPAEHSLQRLRLALSKVVAAWRGEAGWLCYELILMASTIMRLEKLSSAERRHAMTEIVEKVLSVQDKREKETADAQH